MRWLMLLLAILGLGVAFTAKTPGLLFMGIVMMLVGSTGFVFGLIAARVATVSRSQVYVPTPEEIAIMRQKAERQRQGGSASTPTTTTRSAGAPSAGQASLASRPTAPNASAASGTSGVKPEWKRVAPRRDPEDLDESV